MMMHLLLCLVYRADVAAVLVLKLRRRMINVVRAALMLNNVCIRCDAGKIMYVRMYFIYFATRTPTFLILLSIQNGE